MTAHRATPRRDAAGFTLIEILVTILLLMIGLLGVIGMQTRASAVEFESYQRGQALSLARDMEAHLLSSRGILAGFKNAAVSSTDGSVYLGYGTGAAAFTDVDGNCIAPTGDALSAAKFQVCTWGRDLQGVAQKDGGASGVAVGAMIGARGCIIRIEPPQLNALGDFYVVVVWQGIGSRTEPPSTSPAAMCASGVNFGSGLRRGVSIRVMVPDLQKST